MKTIDDILRSFANENITRGLSGENYRVLKSAFFAESADSGDGIIPRRPPKEELRQLVGKLKRYSEDIGSHPDFAHLKEGNHEYHYIVSVFVDIKGSTLLSAKMNLKDVRYIKNGMLVTAIDIFQAFDGHIHRLQGDALLAFFGRKSMSKADAIIDALNASSVLLYFVQEHLSPEFEKSGFPPLKIRIGLDFGDDEDVLWTKYGIKNCSEITTTSLHTDLAAKMQARAASNSTMMGDNIVRFLDLPDEFYEVKTYTKGGKPVEDRYAIQNVYKTYPMWALRSQGYVSRLPFMETPSTFNYKSPRDFRVKCRYKSPSEDNYSREYLSNCGALPKGMDLRFELEVSKYVKYDDVEWRVNNRGEEASLSDALDFEMPQYRRKNYCLQSTRFLGHHYMICTLKNQGRILGREQFGVFVRK